MIRAIVLAVLFAAAWSDAGLSQTTDCLTHDAAVRGELKLLKTRHPAGYPIEALMFVFKPPICVMVVPALTQGSEPERLDISAMHIVPKKQEAARLKRALRTTVAVKGNIVESHTAWHQGDAIMFEAEIVDAAR
jgi:hypothetical protein